jgi:hypothetical protein
MRKPRSRATTTLPAATPMKRCCESAYALVLLVIRAAVSSEVVRGGFGLTLEHETHQVLREGFVLALEQLSLARVSSRVEILGSGVGIPDVRDHAGELTIIQLNLAEDALLCRRGHEGKLCDV